MRRPPPPLRAALVMLWSLIAILPGAAQGQLAPQHSARPLDHDDFERWRVVRGEILSPDGGWLVYALAGLGEAGRLRVQAVPGGPSVDLPRGRTPLFTADSRYLAVTIDAQRGAGAPDTLALIDLEAL